MCLLNTHFSCRAHFLSYKIYKDRLNKNYRQFYHWFLSFLLKYFLFFTWKLTFLKKTFCRSLVNSKCSTTKPCHNSIITGRCSLDVCNQAWPRANWTKELSWEVIWASSPELRIVLCSRLHRHHQTHKWSDIPSLNNLVWKINPFVFLWIFELYRYAFTSFWNKLVKKYSYLVQSLVWSDYFFCTWSHDLLSVPCLYLHFRWQICLERCSHSHLCHKCRWLIFSCFHILRFWCFIINNSPSIQTKYFFIWYNWSLQLMSNDSLYCPLPSYTFKKDDFVTALHTGICCRIFWLYRSIICIVT